MAEGGIEWSRDSQGIFSPLGRLFQNYAIE